MGCVLEINNLTKKYSAFELKSISFQIKAGEVMGFIGRNGAGKTTAIKSILNLVHPDAGNVRILGMDYPDNEDEIKQQIGYVVGGPIIINLNCQIKLDFSSNSEKLGRVIDNSTIS